MKKWIGRWRRSLKRRSRSDVLGPVYIAGAVMVALVFAWGLYGVVSYAYEAEALAVRGITVRGLTHVSEGDVLAQAGFTAGTNILELDLDAMRESIEGLRWVKHARVGRVWPREIVISVMERDPIALARIDGQIFQVDEEGVILPVDAAGLDDSPILDGLRLDDQEGNQARIQIYRETIGLIGEGVLSEVHITEAGEVSVVPSNFPILVELGLDQHLERWERYLENSVRIREEYPRASAVDLRFEDQVIIKPGDDQPARSLTWDDETRLL